MTTMVELIAAGDATTNGAPNSFSTVDPYGTNGGRRTPQQSWITQAKKALVALQPEDSMQLAPPHCQIDFNPSGGAAVTFTVTMWRFNLVSKTWYKPGTNASKDLTGPTTDYLENYGSEPWAIQLGSISAGTVQITYDSEVMTAI